MQKNGALACPKCDSVKLRVQNNPKTGELERKCRDCGHKETVKD